MTASMPRRHATVTGATLLGAGLLGKALRAQPDTTEFYTLTSATAATWTIGAILTNPSPWTPPRASQAVRATATGAAAFAVFYGAARVARRIPVLEHAIHDVLRYARHSPSRRTLLVALLSGAAEEVFFRGPVYDMSSHHPVATSTTVYCLATTPTRNPALLLAAAVMGTVFALQRRATDTVWAPLLTHLTWSTLMVRYLPDLFATDHHKPPQPTSL
ncbi:CPBP family intramembrane glutamic endopeptidase [Nocardia terpenica]|uniref:CPBP family intramembrane glutamic endopeptidase n=1 Tax=Nocardia terpenica TaxID=455432 RepID=UPI001E423B77|nr:CPBP family intramembrane glutamic endopeptidase [Nocardia terpenica]